MPIKAWGCNNTFLCRKEFPAFGKGTTLCKIVAIFFAELLGTGILLHFGCMGVLIGHEHILISLGFGFAVATVIQCIGAISGGHVNPAVSVAALILGKITAPLCTVYVIAQFIGAFLGYALLVVLTPEEFRLDRTCCTLPAPQLSLLQALFCEFVATSVLVFLFCGCCDRRNDNKQDSTPIKFGIAVALLVAAVGPYTGASLNTVRTFGPALMHNSWDFHWIYWIAPFMASVFVPILYRLCFSNHDDIPPNAHRSVTHENMRTQSSDRLQANNAA